MWAKNLLFVAVCIAGLAAFKATVFPATAGKIHGSPLAKVATSMETAARVDAAFAQWWSEQHVQPSEPAAELAVARRLSLALTGTIPSLEEIRRFEIVPPGERIERWLDELLADRRSADFVAERLARAWVGVEDGPFLVYRRRRFVAWLADQLASNVPYDEIVAHLIADSGLWTDTPATNFITVTGRPEDGNQPDANRLAARVSRALLGVRIDCAECHDHPFDVWKQRDFQGLAAFFGSARQSLHGIHDVAGNYQIEDQKTGRLETIACQVPFDRALLAAGGSPRTRLASWVTHPENRAFGRAAVNRVWALLFGRPLVAPVDNLPPDDNLSPDGTIPQPLDILAEDFAASGYDLRRLIRTVASTRAFRLESKLDGATDEELQRHEACWAVFPLTRLRPEQVAGALLQSGSLATIDYQSHILVRAARVIRSREFIERYGEADADEFEPRGGTIPQRLLMMNGQIVGDKTSDSLLGNAATQIAVLAPSDRQAVETAMLAVLTRRPDDAETEYFAGRLAGAPARERIALLGDLYWTLLNSTEFSWNH